MVDCPTVNCDSGNIATPSVSQVIHTRPQNSLDPLLFEFHIFLPSPDFPLTRGSHPRGCFPVSVVCLSSIVPGVLARAREKKKTALVRRAAPRTHVHFLFQSSVHFVYEFVYIVGALLRPCGKSFESIVVALDLTIFFSPSQTDRLYRTDHLLRRFPTPEPPFDPLRRFFLNRRCLRTTNRKAGRLPLPRARSLGSNRCRRLGQVWARGQLNPISLRNSSPLNRLEFSLAA